jgi:hypothetical protein
MRKTQHEKRVPNSSANPLPTAFFGAEIPLSEVSPHRIQTTDMLHVLDLRERVSRAEKRFSPDGSGCNGVSHR